MKILNLYAGIGGNRKLWKDTHQITAVELDEKIAAIYKQSFPNDNVIVADAHEYLLDNYKKYDFIWSSPPCQTHSRTNYFTQSIRKRAVYPSMKLYEEIIFLQNFYKGKYCVENVISYYEPLIKPIQIGRHYVWVNFNLPNIEQPKGQVGGMNHKEGYNTANKKSTKEINAVNSELGLHILNRATDIIIDNKVNQNRLF
tara:strand:+ start:77 stop:673 length:597 start_codon:yes stop_codon:yes gene_type:complete